MRFSCLAIAAMMFATTASSPGARDTNHALGLIVSGSITEGGSANHFRQSIDLASGHSKRIQQMGQAEAQFGFDGQPWEEYNGIVMVTNLPPAVAQRRAKVWIDQQAWQERMAAGGQHMRRVVAPGGVPISLKFDPASGFLREAIVAGDWGPIVFSYGDWRRAGPFTYPFHREELGPTGEHTIIQVDVTRLVATFPKGSLSRPRGRSHAEPIPGGTATIPFTALGSKKSHILVDATINDKAAKLIFDTGAANYVTTDAAARLGIQATGGVNLSGVGETSETGGYATVHRIALGGAALRDETLVVGPSPFPPNKGKPANPDGFTGFEFLAEYITTIDYPAESIRFATDFPTDSRAMRVPFYNDGSHIYLRAEIEGIEGYFGLDTGDGGTVTIFPAFAERMETRDASGKVTSGGGGVGGALKTQSGVVKRFSLGGLMFNQLPVEFSQNKTGGFASKSIAGNLGGGVLRCFRITIDFPNHLLLLEPVPESRTCTLGGTVKRAQL